MQSGDEGWITQSLPEKTEDAHCVVLEDAIIIAASDENKNSYIFENAEWHILARGY